MNKKQFKKKLNNKISYSDIRKFIISQEKFGKFNGKIFSRFRKQEVSCKDFIIENYNKIIEKLDTEDLFDTLLMLKYEYGIQYLSKDNFFQIWNKYNLTNKDESYMHLRGFVTDFITHSKENVDFIRSNVDNILETISPDMFVDMSQIFKKISKDEELTTLKNKLNKYYAENKEGVVKSIIESSTYTSLDDYVPTMVQIFDELFESEKCKFADMKVLGQGTFSKVFGVGEKVVKIGKTSPTFNIPNHRRVLQPLIRTNFIQKGKEKATIEICEKVDTNLTEKDLDEENLYRIYKELREEGIIWTDLAKRNLGKLTKPNYTYLNGEIITPDSKSRGFDKNITENVLDAGELVIIDNGYMYLEDDKNISWKSTPQSFEKRYQKEKAMNVIDEVRSDEEVAFIDQKSQISNEKRMSTLRKNNEQIKQDI